MSARPLAVSLGLLPLSLLALGCGVSHGARSVSTAKAAKVGKPAATCPVVRSVVDHSARQLEAIITDADGRASFASALGALRSEERVFREVVGELSQLGPAPEPLGAAVRDLTTESRRSADVVHHASAVMEKGSPELWPLGQAVEEAAADIATSCAKPKAPKECKAVVARLEQLRTAAGNPAAIEAATSALSAASGPALASKVARLTSTTNALSAKTKAVTAELAGDTENKSFAALGRATKSVDAVCGPRTGRSDVSPALASEWVAAAKPDVRKLTVIVRTRPATPLAAAFKSYAQKGDELAPMYRAVAEGGFGSGLVLVHGSGTDKRVFVVTNRHVVDLADEAEISLDNGVSLGRVPVLYVDDYYDLAVLELPKTAPFDSGFGFAASAAKDQLPVIATGFPGVGHEPSYQTTRGYVSNERFVVKDEGRALQYVQHTAPIDGGSSGGPLTDEAGALLGVNTLKLRGRENVGLAAPAFAVAEVAHHATELGALGREIEWRKARARDACLSFVGELAAPNPRSIVLERLTSSWLVAREGMESLRAISESPEDDDIGELWASDPLAAMRLSVVLRMLDEAHALGGASASEVCDHPSSADWANLATSDRLEYTLRFVGGERKMAMRWEVGQWRVVSTSVLTHLPAGPSPKFLKKK